MQISASTYKRGLQLNFSSEEKVVEFIVDEASYAVQGRVKLNLIANCRGRKIEIKSFDKNFSWWSMLINIFTLTNANDYQLEMHTWGFGVEEIEELNQKFVQKNLFFSFIQSHQLPYKRDKKNTLSIEHLIEYPLRKDFKFEFSSWDEALLPASKKVKNALENRYEMYFIGSMGTECYFKISVNQQEDNNITKIHTYRMTHEISDQLIEKFRTRCQLIFDQSIFTL
jgi:hypothetical protein